MAEENSTDYTLKGNDQVSDVLNKIAGNLNKLKEASGKVGESLDKSNARMRKMIEGFARGAQGMAQFTAGVRVMNSGLSGAVAGMTTMASGLKNMSRSMNAVTAGMGKMGLVVSFAGTAFAGLAAASVGSIAVFTSLGRSSISTARSIENLNVSLRVLTKSQESANEAMMIFREFARTSPFELLDVASGGRQLLAYGFALKDVNDLLRDAGDLAAGMQVPIREITRALGRLKGGDFGEAFERFRDFGINIRELFPRMFNRGGEFLGTVEQALDITRKVIRDRFSGMQAEAAKSFDGMVSMLSDAWTRFADLIARSGLFETVKGIMSELLADIETFAANGKLIDWAQKIGGALTMVVQAIMDLIPQKEGISSLADSFFSFGEKATIGLSKIIKTLPLVLDGIILFWDTLSGIFNRLKDPKGLIEFVEILGRLIVDEFKFFSSLAINIIRRMVYTIGNVLMEAFPAIVGYFSELGEAIVNRWKVPFLKMKEEVYSFIVDLPDWTVFLLSAGTASSGWEILGENLGRVRQELEAIGQPQVTDGVVSLFNKITAPKDLSSFDFSYPFKRMEMALREVMRATGDPQLEKRLDDLKDKLGEIWKDWENNIQTNMDGLGVFTRDTQVEIEKQEGFWARLFRKIKEGYIGPNGVFVGVTQGFIAFRRTAGEVADQVSKSTQEALGEMTGSLRSGIETLIFGGDQEGAAKDAIKQIRKVTDVAEDLILEIYNQNGALTDAQVAQFEALFDPFSRFGLDNKTRTKIDNLHAQILGVNSPEGISAFLNNADDLIDELSDSTGFLGRIRQLGVGVKKAFAEGAKGIIVTSISSPLEQAMVTILEEAYSKGIGWAGEFFGGFFSKKEDEKPNISNAGEEMARSIVSGWDGLFTGDEFQITLPEPNTDLFDGRFDTSKGKIISIGTELGSLNTNISNYALGTIDNVDFVDTFNTSASSVTGLFSTITSTNTNISSSVISKPDKNLFTGIFNDMKGDVESIPTKIALVNPDIAASIISGPDASLFMSVYQGVNGSTGINDIISNVPSLISSANENIAKVAISSPDTIDFFGLYSTVGGKIGSVPHTIDNTNTEISQRAISRPASNLFTNLFQGMNDDVMGIPGAIDNANPLIGSKTIFSPNNDGFDNLYKGMLGKVNNLPTSIGMNNPLIAGYSISVPNSSDFTKLYSGLHGSISNIPTNISQTNSLIGGISISKPLSSSITNLYTDLYGDIGGLPGELVSANETVRGISLSRPASNLFENLYTDINKKVKGLPIDIANANIGINMLSLSRPASNLFTNLYEGLHDDVMGIPTSIDAANSLIGGKEMSRVNSNLFNSVFNVMGNKVDSIDPKLDDAFNNINGFNIGSINNEAFLESVSPVIDSIDTINGGFALDVPNWDVASSFDPAKSGSQGAFIKDNLKLAVQGAFVGAGIGSMFGPTGAIGGAIGGALGSVIGASFGQAQAGQLAGSLIGSFIGKIFGDDGGEKKNARNAAFAIQSLGGIQKLFEGRQIDSVFRATPGQSGAMNDLINSLFGNSDTGMSRDLFKQQLMAGLGLGKDEANQLWEVLRGNSGIETLSQFTKNKLTEVGLIGMPVSGFVAPPPAESPPPGPVISGGEAGGSSAPPPVASPPPISVPPVGATLNSTEAYLTNAANAKSFSKSTLKQFGWDGSAGVAAAIGSLVTKTGLDLRSFGLQFKTIITGSGDGGMTEDQARMSLGQSGYNITARTGLRSVPGPQDMPVPAILHGGERVLTASQARQMDSGISGGNVSITINIHGNGDEYIKRAVLGTIPEIEKAVSRISKSNSRFGRHSMDSRSIRSELTN